MRRSVTRSSILLRIYRTYGCGSFCYAYTCACGVLRLLGEGVTDITLCAISALVGGAGALGQKIYTFISTIILFPSANLLHDTASWRGGLNAPSLNNLAQVPDAPVAHAAVRCVLAAVLARALEAGAAASALLADGRRRV